MNIQVKAEIAACPGAPSFQEIMHSGAGPYSEILERRSNPPQSRADIPFERYTSQAFFDLEMQKVWRKVWQYVCREDEVAEAGDYLVYDIGRHSIVVTRDEGGTLKAYHNSCLHRGTKLKPSGSSGWSPQLQCPYHGWTWNLDGALNEVPCAWEFPHLDYEANRLPQARVEAWNGLVFINLDKNAAPLIDYLGVLPEHFSNWPWTDWYLALHLEKELHCNWKTAQEAFMEAYHTPVVHPQLTQVVGDWNMQHDVFDDHVSRDLCAFAVCSPAAREPISDQERLDRVLLGGRSPTAVSVMLEEGQSARDAMAPSTPSIDASGSTTAGGFILPNDHVDILRTRRDEDALKAGGAEAYVTDVLLSNMRVLAIGQNVQEKNGERVVVGSNATLEADPREAEILIMAQRTGQLSMTLRSMLDAKKSDAPATDRPETTGVTVVRFGVATALGKK